jgi:hypothetical protein
MLLKNQLLNKDKLTLAVNMLYLVVGIGVVRALFSIFRHIEVRDPTSLIITKLIIYVVSIYLIIQISKCKNWARWLIVVILTISIPLTILPALGQISHNPVFALLLVMQLILYIAALVILFHEDVSKRFKS